MDILKEQCSESDLYQGYELLTLLSTFYAKAYNHEYNDERKQYWNQNIDLIIEDVERIYEIWKIVDEEIEYGLPLQADLDLKKIILKLKKRFMNMQKGFHDWVILRRVPSILIQCEKRFALTLSVMQRVYPLDNEELSKIAESGEQRIRFLQALEKHFQSESAALRV